MGQQQSKSPSSTSSLLTKTISSPSTPLTPISRPSAHVGTPITPPTPISRVPTAAKSASSPLTPGSRTTAPTIGLPSTLITPVDRVSGFVSTPVSSPVSPPEDITAPAAPRELTRISDILDPRDLIQDTPTRQAKPKMVHSPSGHKMEVDQFLSHPDRPLAMWERQERVRQATMEGIQRLQAESRAGNRSRVGSRDEGKGKNKKGRVCSCWVF